MSKFNIYLEDVSGAEEFINKANVVSDSSLENAFNSSVEEFKFKDTYKFRQPALTFMKHGYYTDAIKGSRDYFDFWDTELERITHGFTVDNIFIPPDYYFFLNYCPMETVVEKKIIDEKGRESTYSERETNFPNFWDAHYRLFMGIHIARYGIKLEDYRELPIDLGLIEDEDNLKGGHHFLFLAPRGVGKCLAPDTKVMLYEGGFKKAKDVVVGDILMGINSQPRKVLKTHSGIDEMFEITQNKGMSYTVNSEHLISLKRNRSWYKGDLYKNAQCGDIINIPVKELLKQNSNFTECFSGFREAVDYSYKEIELDPYILGVWLGDGVTSVPRFTVSDMEIVDYINSWALTNNVNLTSSFKNNCYHIGTSDVIYGKKNYFNLQLNKLNLIGNKHIPDSYLYTSKEIRLKLLAGLLDTDGFYAKGTFDIAQKSEKLANQIKILANGLGLRCTINKIIGKIKSINFEGEYYRLQISGDVDIIPTKVLRKKAILTKNKNKMISGIKSITPKGLGEYYGFEVDGDNLFLLEDGTVTHNSYIQAALSTRRYFTVKKAACFHIAGDKAYLTEDGVYTKFYQYVTHLNTHTAFTQYSDVKNDFNSMHLRASYRDALGNEKGRLSEVIGKTIGDGKVNKLRGKRGLFIIEEIGSLPVASELWKTIRAGTEQGNQVYGQIVAMGTGGDVSGGAEFMEKAFYQPEPFNILKYQNNWDNGLAGTECAFFLPATYNVSFIDAEGNTDRKTSLKFIEEKRRKAAKSKDASDLLGVKAEEPLTPSEALLRVDSTLFPKAQLLQWKQEILANNLHNHMVTNGYFVEKGNNKVEFVPDQESIPVNKYPHDKRLPLQGCVSIFEIPHYEGTKIPNNLYSVVVDPYYHETGTSLGAIYVMKNINNFSKPDDCIVASYRGRPDSMEQFHKMCYHFSLYYNAKIGIENNAGQTLITWFKTHKLLHCLAPEFELSFNEAIPKSSVRRGFGMHIDKRRKEIGLAYLAEWLTSKWYITDDGEQLFNFHKIFDLGFLDELINFNPDGNFDSCLIAGEKVLTQNGYKSIEHLKIGEKVVTLSGKLNSITMEHKNLYKGDLFTFRPVGQYNTLSTTEKHPILVRRYDKKPYGRNFMKMKNALPKAIWVDAKDVKMGDFVLNPVRKDLKKSNIPDDLLYVLGWYISDGWSSQGQSTIKIFLHISQLEIANDLVNIINKYYKSDLTKVESFEDKNGRIIPSYYCGKKTFAKTVQYKYDSKNMITVVIHNKNFQKFCEKHCGKPNNKLIGKELFNSSNLLPFLKGFFEGDGCYQSSFRKDGYYRSTLIAATVYPLLAEQIRQILLEHGIWCSTALKPLSRKNPKLKDQIQILITGKDCLPIIKDSKKFKQENSTSIEVENTKYTKENYIKAEEGYWIPLKEVIKTDYEGYVYNISVENDETYVANNILTHNCSAMIVAMYMMKEVEYKYSQSYTTVNTLYSDYFNAKIFG